MNAIHKTYIADLHIHSRYSRATSKDCDVEHLDLWARKKGIDLIGTGDFTHPAWRQELLEKLEPAEEGLYVLKDAYRIRQEGVPEGKPRFVVTGEISSIYKKMDRVRKVHSLLLLPGLEEAEQLSRRLELIGNIHSDGRPILGLDCRDLLEIMLDTCPKAVYVPAHIWTPHFSLFGAFSGFDSMEDCFEDLTPYIHAVETGLSSDPPMNWRVGALDSYQLISNSDAHSPAKLGREANLLGIELSYEGLTRAVNEGKGLEGTLEFYPEEGKYHFDGHRKCGLCISPQETARLGNRCPICGKKITIGVLNRVEQLADRPEGYVPAGARPFENLVPLPEVIGASIGASASSKKVQERYEHMLAALGPEFVILRQIPIEEIRHAAGFRVAEGIRRLREGEVERIPGYDGEYGKIQLLTEEEISGLEGQLSLNIGMDLKEGQPLFFTPEERKAQEEAEKKRKEKERASAAKTVTDGQRRAKQPDDEAAGKGRESGRMDPGDGTGGVDSTAREVQEKENAGQREAIETCGRAVAVIAGPGSGKTRTLIARLLYLTGTRGIEPSQITAVTFTNKAAEELRSRLQAEEGRHKNALGKVQVGTFHAVCSRFLKDRGRQFLIADEGLQQELAQEAAEKFGLKWSPVRFLRELSKVKNALEEPDDAAGEAFAWYQKRLGEQEAMDYDDLLLETLNILEEDASVKEAVPEEAECAGSGPFSYLLIDEFQDINPLQYRLIRLWNRNGKELFVIGDPDQAIYGFRGSDAHCFDKLKAEYGELQLIRLEENYRSTPQILSAALHVISHNPDTGAADRPGQEGERRMKAMRPAGPRVRAAACLDERQEAIFVAKQINRQIGGIDMLDTEENEPGERDSARSFSDIAVLYRTNSQAALLEKCLRQEGIPYVVAGREDYLMEKEVRVTLYFFQQALHPEDEAAGKICERLLLPMLKDGQDAETGRQRLERLTAKYRKKGKRTKPVRLLEEWGQELAFQSEEAMKKLTDMSVLYASMDEFLENLSLGEDGDIRRCGTRKFLTDAVTLMTLHASKGLEFPVVFLCGLKKGRLPLQFGSTAADIQEERRLCYVGMTRAREELILTWSGERSIFLQELPQEEISWEEAEVKEEPQAEQLSLFDWMGRF